MWCSTLWATGRFLLWSQLIEKGLGNSVTQLLLSIVQLLQLLVTCLMEVSEGRVMLTVSVIWNSCWSRTIFISHDQSIKLGRHLLQERVEDGWRGKFTCNLQLEICDSTKAGSVIYLRPLAKFGETLQGFLELGVSENWEKRYTTIYGNVLQFLNISFQYLLMINDKLHLGVLDPVLEVNLGHEKMTSQR